MITKLLIDFDACSQSRQQRSKFYPVLIFSFIRISHCIEYSLRNRRYFAYFKMRIDYVGSVR